MEYQIEKDVPMPFKRGHNQKYPFGQMEVGDSFGVEGQAEQNIRSAACWYGTRHGKKFSVRKCGTGFRCWRVE